MRNRFRSFRFRVLAMVCALVLTAILLPSMIIAEHTTKVEIQNDEQRIAESFQVLERTLTKMLGEAVDVVNTVAAQPAVEQYVLGQAMTPLEKVENKKAFDQALQSAFYLNPCVTDILFLHEDRTLQGSSLDWHYSAETDSWSPFHETAFLTGARSRTTDWCTVVQASSLLPSMPSEPQRTGWRICAANRLSFTYAGAAPVRGVVMVTAISEQTVRDCFVHLSGAGAQVMVLSADGTCLSSTREDAIGQPAFFAERLPEQKSGSFSCARENGARYQVFYRRLNLSGWVLARYVPMDVYLSAGRSMRRLTLWICAAAALVLIPLTALWSRSICRPLEDLAEVMRRVRDGELNRRVVSREHDAEEVRLVAEQTNQMLASINDLIARNEENERAKHRLEMRTLQAQITPHFLFNTLTSIRWAASMSGSEHVARLLELFTRLLHPIFSDWSEEWTLRQELAYTQNYVDLIHLRFNGQLPGGAPTGEEKIRISIECACEDGILPRFTLQPILENCCEHAQTVGRTLQVSVRIEPTAEGLLCTIRDDGAGMDAATLERLTETLQCETEPARGPDGHRHIGMYNIHRRLLMLYGEGSGLSIDSAPGLGTTVTLRVNRGV